MPGEGEICGLCLSSYGWFNKHLAFCQYKTLDVVFVPFEYYFRTTIRVFS